MSERIWTSISLTQKDLLEEVREKASLEAPSKKTVADLAEKYDESQEYIELCFKEYRKEAAKRLAEEIGSKKRRFIRVFSKASDKWLSYHLGLGIKEIRQLRRVLQRNGNRR